jgi:predicted GIY-YIG superfamily endonuclease
MHFVYGLIDPRTEQVCYIGITDDAHTRFLQHISCRDDNVKKNEWIKRLRDNKLIPSMKIIETVETVEHARTIEKELIQHYVALGVQLVNRQLFIKAENKIGDNLEVVGDDEILSSAEVVELLDADAAYLAYLRRSNQLIPVEQKTIKIKPRLQYRRSDVEAFIQRRRSA